MCMPKAPKPEKPAGAPPPPDVSADTPEVAPTDATNTTVKAKRKGVSALKIPLSTPGSGAASLNIPR